MSDASYLEEEAREMRSIESQRKLAIAQSKALLDLGAMSGSFGADLLSDVELNIRELLSVTAQARRYYFWQQADAAALRAGAELEFTTAKMHVYKALIIEVNRLLGRCLVSDDPGQCQDIAVRTVRDAMGRVTQGGALLARLRNRGWRAGANRLCSALGLAALPGFDDLYETYRDAVLHVRTVILAFEFDMYQDRSTVLNGAPLTVRQIVENADTIVRLETQAIAPSARLMVSNTAEFACKYIMLLMLVADHLEIQPITPRVYQRRSYLHQLQAWMMCILAREASGRSDPDYVRADEYAMLSHRLRRRAKGCSRRAAASLIVAPWRWLSGRPTPAETGDLGHIPGFRYRMWLNRELRRHLLRIRRVVGTV